MRLHRLIISFKHAGVGAFYLVSTQPNARVHAFASGVVLAVAWWLGVDRPGFVALCLAITLVWAAEAFNTALETLVDLASPAPHPLAKVAKDVAAGAVLICALGATVVGALVLGPPFYARLVGS